MDKFYNLHLYSFDPRFRMKFNIMNLLVPILYAQKKYTFLYIS